MKWLYHYERVSMSKGYNPIVRILLRPTIINPEGYKMIGKVVRLKLTAAEHVMNNPELEESRKDKEFARIYFEELNTKDYYIDDGEVDKDHEIYLATAHIYVKQEGFTPKEVFQWARTYFTIKGYLFTEFEKGPSEDFLDLNPFFNMMLKAENEVREQEKKEREEKKKARRKKKKRRPRKL